MDYILRKYSKLFLIFFCFDLSAKVRILTFHYNQADFIEIQYKTFSKFLEEEFELIVFNDAASDYHHKQIEEICKKYPIECVRYEPKWHDQDPLNFYIHNLLQDPRVKGYWGWNATTSIEEISKHPSVRHSHVIQYALDHYGYHHDDIVILMDGDNFLVKPLSVATLLNSCDILAFSRWGIDSLGNYRKQFICELPAHIAPCPWVVFTAFDPRKIPDLYELKFGAEIVNAHPAFDENSIGDTGSAFVNYLKKHPQIKLREFIWIYGCTLLHHYTLEERKKMGISSSLMKLCNDILPHTVQLFLFEHFLHIGRGSFEPEGHHKVVHHLRTFIDTILNE
jgi:hypothetical protein